ncbi:MAG: TadE/TadG family type IV pilus assembly protein [Micrococcales bacterium]
MSKPSPKLPRSRSERGAAVVEFVMLGTPALLLFGTGVSMFVNSYVDTVLRAVVIDSSRFTALADQSIESGQAYLEAKLRQQLPNVKVGARVERGNVSRTTIEYMSLTTLFNLTSRVVKIEAATPIEK